jgi:hypothetical protein
MLVANSMPHSLFVLIYCGRQASLAPPTFFTIHTFKNSQFTKFVHYPRIKSDKNNTNNHVEKFTDTSLSVRFESGLREKVRKCKTYAVMYLLAVNL